MDDKDRAYVKQKVSRDLRALLILAGFALTLIGAIAWLLY